MRGYADAFEQRRHQQVDDGEDYYVSSANFPLDGITYTNAPASAYFNHQQNLHALPQNTSHLNIVTANHPHMRHDSTRYGGPSHGVERISNYPEVDLHHHYGGISPRHFHDSLVPPNLMQHSPMHQYDMPTSPVCPPPVITPSNRPAMVPHMSGNRTNQNVRYNEQNEHFNLRSPGRRQPDDRNPDDEAEVERYKEIYHKVFARHSRTPSEVWTSTEHTRTDYTRTEHTRTQYTQGQTTTSRSTSESTGSESSTSTSSFSEGLEDDDWEENIRSTLNEMAGNLKNLGGIHCNQAGPDSTEVQLRLNLPVPMQYMDHLDSVAKRGLTQLDLAAKKGFNTAVATLSPKKCNMQYDYSHLDDHVVDMEQGVYGMEERFIGTIHELRGNVMPVYKSLFQSQSEESSNVDEEDEGTCDEDDESTYEDPRFLAKSLQERSKALSTGKPRSRKSQREITIDTKVAPSISRVPSHIVITDAPSDFSSADSWRLSSTLGTSANVTSRRNAVYEFVDETDCHVQTMNDRDSPDWIPAETRKLDIIPKDSPTPEDKQSDAPLTSTEKMPPQMKSMTTNKKPTSHHVKVKAKEVKSKKVDLMAEIPECIDLVIQKEHHDQIVESFSEITTELVDESSRDDLSDPPKIGPVSTPEKDPSPDEDVAMTSRTDEKSSFQEKPTFPVKDEIMNAVLQQQEHESASPLDEKRSFPIDEMVAEGGKPTAGLSPPRDKGSKQGSDFWTKETPFPFEQEEDCASLDRPNEFPAEDDKPVPKEVSESCTEKNTLSPGTPVDHEPQHEVKSDPSSPCKFEQRLDELETSKTSLGPMYLRVLRLRKEKGVLMSKVETESNAGAIPEDLEVESQCGACPKEMVIDDKTNVKEFSKPDLSATFLAEEPEKPEGLFSEDAKLDDAIKEVFGPDERDAPDDEMPGSLPQVAVKATEKKLLPKLDPATVAVEKVPDHATDDFADNVVLKAQSEEMPEDERLQKSDETSLPAFDVSQQVALPANNRFPQDSQTPKTVEQTKNEESTSGTRFDDFDASSLDMPFDAAPKFPKTAENNIAFEMSIYESDQSFQSAREGPISGHSRKERGRTESQEHTLGVVEDRKKSDHTNPNKPVLSCDEIMSDARSTDVSGMEEEEMTGPEIASPLPGQPNLRVQKKSLLSDPAALVKTSSTLEKDVVHPGSISENPSEEEMEVENIFENRMSAIPSNTVAMNGDCKDISTCKKETSSTANDQSMVEDEGDELMPCPNHCLPSEEVADNTMDETCLSDEIDKSGLLIGGEVQEETEPGSSLIKQRRAFGSPAPNADDSILPVLARTKRNRESLYQVQGFAEYCKKIEGFTESLERRIRSNEVVEDSITKNDETEESSSSQVQLHQRTLDVGPEDPEESSIDDPSTRKHCSQSLEPLERGKSSVDMDLGSSDSDSEYSTTTTEDHPNDSSRSRESFVEEKSSIDEGGDAALSFSGRSGYGSSFVDEQSDIDTNSSSGQSREEEDDVLPDMKIMHDQTEHDRHMSATRRFRNQIDVDADEVEIRYLSEHTRNLVSSSDATVRTFDTQNRTIPSMDETLRSRLSRVPTLASHSSKSENHVSPTKAIRSVFSSDTHLTSPLTTSFTMDTPLAAASTISSIRTFDHESVISGQRSELRRQRGPDDEGYIPPALSCLKDEISKQSIAMPIVSSRFRTKTSKPVTIGVYGIVSFLGSVVFSILLFFYEWGRFFLLTIRGKQQAKIEYSPSRLKLSQPDQVLRREEIQDCSMDSFIHRANGRQPYYLHHQIDQREHVATNMTVNPPLFSTPMYEDDADEVGTCVGSIVPDTHPPTWEVISNPKQQRKSTSFGVVKKAYSSMSSGSSRTGWRRTREEEDVNWT
ncbi:hypothetical protein IV203_003238 [Nitzschia inconspicua]|uniref:Uncharacterized protein n=1 Tax=Nitzschia inconspicua TaxID=303405 RepID=A0A9K3L2Y4_9STRA|nr:hypothetical protein IV203_003238 [Nitzschia inconspicua]